MPDGHKKTPRSSQLGGTKEQRGSTTVLPDRLARYGTAKSHTMRLVLEMGSDPCAQAGIRFKRILDCSTWLKFRDYYTGPGVKLHSANFCMNTLVCTLCAIRRASRNLSSYLERLQKIQKKNPELKPYLVTLTVRNTSTLSKGLEHLTDSLKLLNRRRTDNKSNSLMREISGGVYSIEVTHSDATGWHPHVHAIWLSESPPDMYALRSEWEQITGDSFMCDVRPIQKIDNCPADIDPYVQGFAEVFKYALKPSELGAIKLLEAYPILKGKRLLGSFGLFRGVPQSTELNDDLTGLDDLPYVEYLFNYLNGKYNYVNAA